MSLVLHKRGECENAYSKLTEQNYDNTKCLLLHCKNSGQLNPEDVTFNDKTWLENSADLLGINHTCIVIDKPYTTFAYTDKIPYFLIHLKNMTHEYVLIADSVDCIINGNPDDAIELLNNYNCDILYSTTPWNDHDNFTMPERSKFNDKVFNNIKLNSGVCIGKVDTLVKLFERVLEYASYEPIRYYHPTYRKKNGYMQWTAEQLKNFPKGCSDDQTIIRYLVMEFYPRIQLDTKYKLTSRRG